MDHLPPEVIRSIVSRLDPLDCIECLRVCRHWQHIIPTLAARPWRDSTVDFDSYWMLSQIHVFGRFVRTARIRFKQYGSVTKAMHHLKACSSLERLELCDPGFTSADDIYAQLVSCLKSWPRLDTFAFTDVDTRGLNLADYILLAAKHNVRHIVCTGGTRCRFQLSEDSLQSSNLNALKSLVIDYPDIREDAIRALLSFTPNLEYLAVNGSNLFDYLLDENNEIRDPPLLGNTLMSFIFTACPKIAHFHLDCRSGRLDVLDDDLQFPTKKAAAAVSDDDDQQAYPGSLRYYWNGLSEFDHAEYDMILKCQSTLEHLFISHIESSNFKPVWETFTRCFLPNTTLKYLSLPVTDQPMDWLNACQALEHLELHDIMSRLEHR